MHARENAGLAHHGDADLVPGLVDLAVNVRSSGTPSWLAARIREADLAAYPDQRAAVAAVAARHRRAADEVLLTAGAAEAFVLLARALQPRHAVVVHPQFTEPEAALRAAGHQVDQVILPFPFTLDPTLVPADADLVFIGNPTNPTSVAHPRDALLQLVRPGRIVVVDEAFADCLPGEPESVAGQADLDGLVVIRSLTKTWALAGLRVGYLLAAPDIVRLLAAAQPPWPVSSPALAACVATASDCRRARGRGLVARSGGRARSPAWPARGHRRGANGGGRGGVVRAARHRDRRRADSLAPARLRRPPRRDVPRFGTGVDPRRRPRPRDLRPFQRRAAGGDRRRAARQPGDRAYGDGAYPDPTCRDRPPRPASARPDVASSCSAAAGRGSPGTPSSCSRVRRR